MSPRLTPSVSFNVTAMVCVLDYWFGTRHSAALVPQLRP
jgi:hypothetical protein